MKRGKKIKIIFLVLFRLMLLVAAGIFIYEKNWFNLLLSILTLALTFLPSLLEKRLKVDYPEEFEIIILFFIFASMFLGEINSFYMKYWWWDLFLHGLSAIILGLLAFSLIYILNKEKKITLRPEFIALFAFCFALAGGALWEILEFSIDSLFETNMQKSGLRDTMADIMVDALGALLISLIGFLYAKGYLKFLRFLEEDFLKVNKKLFK
ncbi:MAG: hypothetical protein ACP5OG_04650 [Candidatus Nanoarchaeia archaeon]